MNISLRINAHAMSFIVHLHACVQGDRITRTQTVLPRLMDAERNVYREPEQFVILSFQHWKIYSFNRIYTTTPSVNNVDWIVR